MKPYDEAKLSVGRADKHRDSTATEYSRSVSEAAKKFRSGPLAGRLKFS